MKSEIILSAGLDKFSVGLSSKMGNGCAENDLKRMIPHARNVITGQFRHKVISSTKCKSHKRHIVYSDDGKYVLAKVHTGYAGKVPFINFEFNPSKITGTYKPELDALLQMSLYDHFDTLVSFGVVAHAEFFIDINGVSLNELALVDIKRRKGTVYKGTQYLGRRTSTESVVMYDRGAKLASKAIPPSSCGGKGGDTVTTRIEARIANRGISFENLVDGDVENPHESYIVVPRVALEEAAAHFKYPQLALGLMQPGISALTKGNAGARKSIVNFLKCRQVEWWDNQAIWNAHLAQLKVMKGTKGWSDQPMFA